MRREGMKWRCRKCGKEFRTKPSPNRFVTVKCPDCGSDDVECM